MTNTSGSGDQGVSERPQSTPVPPPPAASQSIATPVSVAPANTTTVSTRIVTNPSASAGRSSISRTGAATASQKKRGNVASEGGGTSQPRSVRPNVAPSICAVCEKEFQSPKALFGHMNCHPNRGWKGAYPPPPPPPPEFADLQAQVNQRDEVVGDPAVPALPDLNETQPPPAEPSYKLPDLNLPPPEEE